MEKLGKYDFHFRILHSLDFVQVIENYKFYYI